MKEMIRHIAKSVFMLAVAVGAVACSGVEENLPEKVKIVLKAEMETSQARSRAGYLTDVGSHWDNGDEIVLWMGKNNRNISLRQQSLSDDGKRAVFASEATVSGEVSQTIGAVYLPDGDINSSGRVYVTLPEVQDYVEGGYSQIPMVGSAITMQNNDGYVIDNAAFAIPFAVLKLNIKSSSATLNSIVISSLDELQMAGALSIFPHNPEAVMSWKSTSSPAQTITLDCHQGVELSSSAKSFYIVVPSGELTTFGAGLKMEFHTSKGVATKTTQSLGEFSRNTIYETPVLTLRNSDFVAE